MTTVTVDVVDAEEAEWNKLERAEGLAEGSTKGEAKPYTGPREGCGMGIYCDGAFLTGGFHGKKPSPPTASERKAWAKTTASKAARTKRAVAKCCPHCGGSI